MRISKSLVELFPGFLVLGDPKVLIFRIMYFISTLICIANDKSMPSNAMTVVMTKKQSTTWAK